MSTIQNNQHSRGEVTSHESVINMVMGRTHKMLYPEFASEIVARLPEAGPVLATKGVRKGQHAQKSFRFTLNGSTTRHIAIARQRTLDGTTVYVNMLAASGRPYPHGVPDISVSEHYGKGHQGRTGDKGIAASVAALPTLSPKQNDVLRLSVSSETGLRALLEWYRGVSI